ncbi:MAG: dimethyl sulfoxide reductase anchor subunit [Rhodospirillaceae bacterium]|jgi:sulfite dehydrogenase (quinone) subunit SoeC|nr:dimethyl sulfoxide reductase anchor subunit [Rhodospirillaceae bacterium]
MQPTYSVIFLTTATGAGYGMLALLGLLRAMGSLPDERAFGLFALGLALALITAGLLASTAHLGRPERAWRALSQWRSSWLSREGVLAVAGFGPALLFAFAWLILQRNDGFWPLAGLAAAALSVATVYSTGMIYRSLAAIPRWHHPLVLPVYLALALATGALWLNAVLAPFVSNHGGHALLQAICFAALAAAWLLKIAYWRAIDGAAGDSSTATAIGLGGLDGIGNVRPLDPPHVQDNYLLKEMGFAIARKHAAKLRGLAHLLAFLVPLILIVVQAATSGPLVLAAAALAAVSVSFGVVVERWLFFAEAQHKVMLYYGAGNI